MILLAMLAAATAPAAADKAMVTAYDELCGSGATSPQAALLRADRDGWRKDAPGGRRDVDRIKESGTTTLQLIVRESKTAGERFETCGISVASAQPDLTADVKAMLGFEPALHVGASATFYAVHDQGRWTDASTLTRGAFAAAKAAGTFYSVMALSADTGSSLFSLQILPR